MDRNHHQDIEGEQSGNKEMSSTLRRGSQVFVGDEVRSRRMEMLTDPESCEPKWIASPSTPKRELPSSTTYPPVAITRTTSLIFA